MKRFMIISFVSTALAACELISEDIGSSTASTVIPAVNPSQSEVLPETTRKEDVDQTDQWVGAALAGAVVLGAIGWLYSDTTDSNSSYTGTNGLYSCTFLCRGSNSTATGGRHTLTSWGNSKGADWSTIQYDAQKLCQQENSYRGGGWWAERVVCELAR